MARNTQMITGAIIAITGAGRGIGKATAQALTTRGAKVAIGDIDLAAAEQTAAEIGNGCVALHVDVTDRASVDAFLDQVEERLGSIDVLVNNAGIMPTVRFLDESDASIERQFAINVFGVMHGMRSVLPRMLRNGRGHVINVASTAGKFAAPGVVTYCGTKHAVVGITDSLRAELKDAPVDFSVVMPVIVRTELTDGVADTRGIKALQPEDVAASIVEAIETRRYEVWCPRNINGLYRTSKLLPLRVADGITALTGADKALLNSIDDPARRAYQHRIETTQPTQLPAHGTRSDA